ncbi:unnamed protein product [Rhizoctonia solani]|uniref:Uncharacterized protein n=2 Tax=Rhizoctonia solani TaxID=456999 RepID=A0A8H3BNM4_9AGAM|nr:unnamed protein product [Rhizoctonia solani]
MVERKASSQPCKQVPHTSCCAAGTNNTLPEVAELVSALPKQVQFTVEEGAGNGVGSSRSDSGERDTSAGTAVICKATKHRGCVSGSSGYLKVQEWTIIGGVGKYLLHGKIGWHKVGKKNQCKWERIKDKYGCMTKRKKPASDGKDSKIHDAVLHLEEERLAQEETANLDDEEWLDLDVPVEKNSVKPQEAYVKPKPNTIPAPAPAKFVVAR